MKYDTARRHALALADATEEPHHDYGSWRVRGRIFVTIPPGQTHLHVFVGDDERDAAVAMFPQFVQKLLWGGKVLGVRVELAAAEAAAVKRLVSQAYERQAAKGPARKRGDRKAFDA
jgi:hypothetical protein